MSNTHPKSESIVPSTSTFDPINLESEILQLCRQFPNGVSDKRLENSFQPSTYIYRIRDPMNKSNSSISIGIWMRDIRLKIKLSPTILNKTLKSLESTW
ncbi:unnamed protein product [Rotaria sp. Silwood1]|nr:unnamed protein product [Rotaria sp. Silwood1]